MAATPTPTYASRRARAASSPAAASSTSSTSTSNKITFDDDDTRDAPARLKMTPHLSAVPLRATLLAGGGLWLLFVVALDPPFAAYWLLANALVGLAAANRLAQLSGALRWRVAGLTLLAVVCSTTLLALLREFEQNDLDHYDATPISLASGGGADESRLRVHFLRLYNPQVGYLNDVETIHRAVNSKAVGGGETKSEKNAKLRVQRYAVNAKINSWSSDVLRYNILLQFWSQMDARRDTNKEQDQQHLRREDMESDRVEILCVAETDVVFREAYFSDTLRAYQEQREATQQNLELAHIQHFWGHHTLEPFNIGVLCTSSRASLHTRLWVRLMRALHAKRYRRLLYLDVLYAFLGDRFVFSWDQHHGCTEYYPHCHYVHFTRPKGEGIQKAMSAIALEKEKEA